MDANISTPANATSSDESLKNLTVQIASLEKKMDEQATKIAELHNDCLLLLQENMILKDQVQKLITDIEALIKNQARRCSAEANDEELVNSPSDTSRYSNEEEDPRLCIAMSKKRQKPKNIVKHASVSTSGGSGYRHRSASAGGTDNDGYRRLPSS